MARAWRLRLRSLLTPLAVPLLAGGSYAATLTTTGSWDDEQLFNYLASLGPGSLFGAALCSAGALALSELSAALRKRLAAAIALLGALPLLWQLAGPGLVRQANQALWSYRRWWASLPQPPRTPRPLPGPVPQLRQAARPAVLAGPELRQGRFGRR